jgi:hypothetical protein
MSPINHGVVALAINRKFPSVPFWALLVGVQFFDLLWVALNFVGVERTATSETVAAINDIHFVHMPFSHLFVLSILIFVLVSSWLLNRLAKSGGGQQA